MSVSNREQHTLVRRPSTTDFETVSRSTTAQPVNDSTEEGTQTAIQVLNEKFEERSLITYGQQNVQVNLLYTKVA